MESCERECCYRRLGLNHQEEEKEHEKKQKSATPTPRRADADHTYKYMYNYYSSNAPRSESLPTVSPSEARRTLSPLTPSCSPLGEGNDRRRRASSIHNACIREEGEGTRRASSNNSNSSRKTVWSEKGCERERVLLGEKRPVDGYGLRQIDKREKEDDRWRNDPEDHLEEEGDGGDYQDDEEEETFIVNVSSTFINAEQLQEEEERIEEPRHEALHQVKGVPCALSPAFFDSAPPPTTTSYCEEKAGTLSSGHPMFRSGSSGARIPPSVEGVTTSCEDECLPKSCHGHKPISITNSFGSVSPVPTELSFDENVTTATEKGSSDKTKEMKQKTEKGKWGKRVESEHYASSPQMTTTSLSDAPPPPPSPHSYSCQLSMATLAQIDWVKKHLKAKSNATNHDDDGGGIDDKTPHSSVCCDGDRGVRSRYRKRKTKNIKRETTEEGNSARASPRRGGAASGSSLSSHFSECSLSDEHEREGGEADWSASPLSRYLKLTKTTTTTTTSARSVPTTLRAQPSNYTQRRASCDDNGDGAYSCEDNNNNSQLHLPPSDGRSIMINGSICCLEKSPFPTVDKEEEQESEFPCTGASATRCPGCFRDCNCPIITLTTTRATTKNEPAPTASTTTTMMMTTMPPTPTTASTSKKSSLELRMAFLMIDLFGDSESSARSAIEVEEERDRSQFLEVAFVKMSVAELGRLASGLLSENSSLRKRLKTASKKITTR